MSARQAALASLLCAVIAAVGCGGSSASTTHHTDAHFAPSYLAYHNAVLKGPVLFRLSNPPSTVTGTDFYAVVWKLNRDPCSAIPHGRLKKAGILDHCGEFSVGDFLLTPDYRLDRFPFGTSKKHSTCIGSILDTEGEVDLSTYSVGHNVEVKYRPLDPDPGNNKLPRYGRTFASSPELMAADYSLKTPAARRALRTIGC